MGGYRNSQVGLAVLSTPVGRTNGPAARWGQTRPTLYGCGAALILLVFVGVSPAADIRREFEIAPTILKEAPAYISQVQVPDANCAAVSPVAPLLVVGHRTTNNQHLAVFRLDAASLPAGAPNWITLPKPAVLATNVNYPLGLQFHPKLPLLYVWQDINGPPGDKQENHAAFKNHLEFDHLLLYAVKDGALELIQTGARGTGFHCGLPAGTVGLDAEAKTLFVPNALGATWDEAGIGSYELDDQGLLVDQDKPSTESGKVKGLKTAPKNRFERRVVLLQRKRTHRYYPSGAGWVTGSEAMIMGGYSGCLVIDFNQGNLRQTWFNLPDAVGNCVIAGHPQAPAVYLCLQNTSRLFQIAHSDGFVSLLPQAAVVTGARLTGAPVVLTRQSQVGVGDARSLHLFGLLPDGRLDGKVDQLPLPAAQVRGLAYSEKHGRLYVSVDKLN
ncbi:MAG: hypothetical protein EBS05_15090 [Proteobacteria bacterium]|nr:hypothetical protein [Pseudomonadota bacterium]